MDLHAELARRFDGVAGTHVDAVFALATPGEPLATFSVRCGRLQFEPNAAPDVTFTFDRPETAWGIITGTTDPITAFMAGRFRSDAHLPLAFVLLSLFRPDYAGPPPP